MTHYSQIIDEYFDWMCDLVCCDRFADGISYRKLLAFLHNTEFTYLIERDADRAGDGIGLRYRFSVDIGEPTYYEHIDGPCSVLEMMIALGLRCEENIMDDPDIGDRTAQWFWEMVSNLGLGSMTDDRFNRRVAFMIINRFLLREYDPDGKGGLFYLRNCDCDLREVEIWHQLCWYLDSIT